MAKTETTHTLTRASIGGLTLVSTGAGVAVFAHLVGSDGFDLLDPPLLVLFTVLFAWVAFSFWMATAGFAKCLIVRPPARTAEPASGGALPAPLPRTAILMPVYNEDPWTVFAGLSAMYESLNATGHGSCFDFYVLSDTNDPKTWLEEEMAWASATEQLDGPSGVYYRRRKKNVARKSGNIADFCQRWGSHYRYMIVLDADSVVDGDTMVEMVRRMEVDPRIGILQVPPAPVNRGSLFARLQEFAASVYGRVFTTGFGLWSHTDGNYWGHNAIIRIEPFMQHCGLPTLPGKAPLGGEILSHDFVEAALIRRAGWKVALADDLGGSYEECPATLIDFAQRDQRWCQGNLQHLKIMFLYGFHPLSRVHMGMGVMSYLSASLWLLFMVLGVLALVTSSMAGSSTTWVSAYGRTAIGLFVATMLMLLLPKLWGYLVLLTNRRRLEAHGGFLRSGLGVLLETLVSVLIAPVMMAFHVSFVLFTLLGKKVQWSAQRRQEAETGFREAFAAHAGHTIAGLGAVVLIEWLAPSMLWWLSPVIGGLVLSIPLSMLLSSVAIGQWLRSKGVLAIAEETQMPPVLRSQRAYLKQLKAVRRTRCRVDPFLQVIADPAFNALHLAMLEASGEAENGPGDLRLRSLERVAFYGGPRHMSREDQLTVLTTPLAVRWLHEAAWKHWSTSTLRQVLEPSLSRQPGRAASSAARPATTPAL